MAISKNTTSMSGRAQFWADHLKQWDNSGLSQAQYCRDNNLSTSTFGKWKKRLLENMQPNDQVAVPECAKSFNARALAKAMLVVTDLGVPLKDLSLYNLLLALETAGFDVAISRSLRNLAHSDLAGFVEAISSWRSFRNFLSTQGKTEWYPVKYAYIRYRSARKLVCKYVSVVRYLMSLGPTSIDHQGRGVEYSPYYILGRELPLLVRVPVSKESSNLGCVDIKLFSSGIMCGSIVIPGSPSEGESVGGISKDDGALASIVKEKLGQMKRDILKGFLRERPDYAYYYYDRYELEVYDLGSLPPRVAEKDDAIDASQGDEDCIFRVTDNKALLYCRGLSDRLKRSIHVFEIVLIQRYFLTTRDSYIDKYVRSYQIGGSLNRAEAFLANFIEMLRIFVFKKEEGGKHKLFSDVRFYALYNRVHQLMDLGNLSAQVDQKAKDTLSIFSLVSSMKRERVMIRLTYFIAILTLLLAAQLAVRAGSFLLKYLQCATP